MNALATNRPSNAPWNKLQRAASDLKETPDQLLHVDGVRWDIENLPNGKTTDNGVFSDAYVNPAKVKDVFLVVKPFTERPGNLPGHALLGFEFQPDAPVTSSQGQKDSGLVLSVEFRYREGEEFDPVQSIEDPHPIIYQLGTWSDAIEKATIHDANPMQKYKLKLNDEQKTSLLKERLAAAAADHTTDMYHPVTNSCLSTLIDGVNKVVPEKQRIPHNAPDGSPDVSATVPIWCSSTFRSHGLLAQLAPTVIPANPK
jgi:hypothetical protein